MTDEEIILEQYKLYVEMADRISSRRAQTNRFYISLLSALLGLVSFIVGTRTLGNYDFIVFLAASVLGVALNVLWFLNIHAYKQLNSGKFKVIHEMEQRLPFACYDREWEILDEGRSVKKYLKLTVVEKFVPLLLAIPYVLLFVYSCLMIKK